MSNPDRVGRCIKSLWRSTAEGFFYFPQNQSSFIDGFDFENHFQDWQNTTSSYCLSSIFFVVAKVA